MMRQNRQWRLWQSLKSSTHAGKIRGYEHLKGAWTGCPSNGALENIVNLPGGDASEAEYQLLQALKGNLEASLRVVTGNHGGCNPAAARHILALQAMADELPEIADFFT